MRPIDRNPGSAKALLSGLMQSLCLLLPALLPAHQAMAAGASLPVGTPVGGIVERPNQAERIGSWIYTPDENAPGTPYGRPYSTLRLATGGYDVTFICSGHGPWIMRIAGHDAYGVPDDAYARFPVKMAIGIDEQPLQTIEGLGHPSSLFEFRGNADPIVAAVLSARHHITFAIRPGGPLVSAETLDSWKAFRPALERCKIERSFFNFNLNSNWLPDWLPFH